jgi:hypothetical protein
VVPAQPPAQGTPATAAPASPRPLTGREIRAIRERRSELSDQLTSAANRRSRLVDQLDEVPEAARPGILERISVLDQRIVQLERDIAVTGQQLTGPGGLGALTVGSQYPFGLSEDAFMGVTMSFNLFVLAPIAFAIARRIWKRSSVRQSAAESRQAAERMDRLEQAVDAIAIEVERVGESQRYQARILTEAQLMPALGAGQRAAEPIRMPQYEGARLSDRE